MATRSHSPATEYTSEIPSMPAMAWAASGISSISHWISTTALTMEVSFRGAARRIPERSSSAPLEDHCHSHAARDAQRGQPQRVALLAHLVSAGEHDPGAGHADG